MAIVAVRKDALLQVVIVDKMGVVVLAQTDAVVVTMVQMDAAIMVAEVMELDEDLIVIKEIIICVKPK